jgi:hypothetical protein
MTQPASPAPQEQGDQTRLALGAMLIPLFFVTFFAACIIGTYHKPHPNGIKVGVVGQAAQTAQLRAALEKGAPAAFEIRHVTTVVDAVHAVRDRDLNAAFVPTANPKQPATLIVATAGGRIVATAAETFVRFVTTAQGTQLVVHDVRPLASGDEIGVGIFLFTIVCTICGYLAATLLFTVAPWLLPGRRYAMITGIAVLVPVLAYLIGGLGFGTYTGSAGTIFAFIGVGALYTFVVGAVTRLLQVVFGQVALFVSLAIFIFLNIPSLGATYTSTTLPGFWRFFNHFWIGAEAVNAQRGILYFGGQGVGAYMFRLFAWTAVCVALLLLLISLKRVRQRRRETATPAEAFAAPTPSFAEQS